jgi:hypothetical protein
MSILWNLKEKSASQPQAVHEENIKNYFRAYFPDMPILEVGLWAKIRQVLTFISMQMEASAVQSYNDTKEFALSHSFSNEVWWVEKIKEFQFGDELVVNKGKIGYVSINPLLRIIRHVSVRTDISATSSIDLIIKYAKDNFVLCTEDEKVALIKYINLIKMAGVRIQAREAVADLIKFTVRVDDYIGQQSVIDVPMNQGSGIPFGNVLTAHFKQLPFDGIFTLSDAEQVLQNQFGNRYIRIISADWKPANSGVYTSFSSIISSDGGYFSVDLANSKVTFK